MLAVDDEQARGDHDCRAHQDGGARPGVEDDQAEEERPDHRGVVEGGDERRVAEAIALGEQDLAYPAEDAGRDQEDQVEEIGHHPAERHGDQRAERREQGEIDDDGRRRFVARQAPRLGRGKRPDDGAGDREERPDEAALAGVRGLRADIVREDDQHAEKPDGHRRPAVDVDLLAQQEDGEDHRHQRRGIADGGGVGDRQHRQGGETAEHRRAAGDRTHEMAEEALGVEDGQQLAAPADPDEDRDQGKEAPAKDDLADRIAIADQLDQRRHGGEGEGRGDFERDAEQRPRMGRQVHGELQPTTWKPAAQDVLAPVHRLYRRRPLVVSRIRMPAQDAQHDEEGNDVGGRDRPAVAEPERDGLRLGVHVGKRDAGGRPEPGHRAAEADGEGEEPPIVAALLKGKRGERDIVEHRGEKAETEGRAP